MEVFGRYVAVSTVMILLFFMLVTHNGSKLQRIRQSYVGMLRGDFVEKVMRDGEITRIEWENFYGNVVALGEVYEISLAVGTREVVWDEEEHTDIIYKLRYESEIMEELYQKGRYRLKKGEYVIVEVCRVRGIGKRGKWMGMENS